MKFENDFVVQAPAGDVWSTLMDIERVTPCMPGAEVLERIDDDAYKVGVKVKVGPISMQYRGQVEIVERDDATRTATLRARAKEARGQGTANADIHMHLLEEPSGTRAVLDTEVQLAGRAAAMGQSVIADVSASLIKEFASNLTVLLEPGETNGVATPVAAPLTEEAPPVPGASPPREVPVQRAAATTQNTLPVGRIVAGVVAARLRRPRTLVALTVGFAAVFLAIRYANRRVA